MVHDGDGGLGLGLRPKLDEAKAFRDALLVHGNLAGEDLAENAEAVGKTRPINLNFLLRITTDVPVTIF
jgi:hypothetical protein